LIFFSNHYQWLFSGLGIVVVGFLFKVFFWKNTKLNSEKNQNVSIKSSDNNKIQIIQNQNVSGNLTNDVMSNDKSNG